MRRKKKMFFMLCNIKLLFTIKHETSLNELKSKQHNEKKRILYKQIYDCEF